MIDDHHGRAERATLLVRAVDGILGTHRLRARVRVPAQSSPVNGFSLIYEGFDLAEEGLREALTSTGNGYLCTRGTAEWEDADGVHYPGTYGHGVYNRETTILGGVPVLNEDLVNLPNWLVLKLRSGRPARDPPFSKLCGRR